MKKKTTTANPSLNKGARAYISHASKAVAHPVRQKILHSLKESAKSTTKLEEEVDEDRYNLYHHLKTLEDANLIEKASTAEGKGSQYVLKGALTRVKSPIVISGEEIKAHPKAWDSALKAVGQILGAKLFRPEKIKRAVVYFEYQD